MKTQIGIADLKGNLVKVEFQFLSDVEVCCKVIEENKLYGLGYIFYTSPKTIIEVIKEKSDREKAIEWWNRLNIYQQNQLYLNYFGCRATYQFPDEIEQIWRKEIQQLREDADCCFQRIDEKPQVDFGRLSLTLNHILSNNEIIKYYAQSELFNLELFLELLSKSSAFAHKAHKELKKLNSK